MTNQLSARFLRDALKRDIGKQAFNFIKRDVTPGQ